jgi:hypothetical protein
MWKDKNGLSLALSLKRQNKPCLSLKTEGQTRPLKQPTINSFKLLWLGLGLGCFNLEIVFLDVT